MWPTFWRFTNILSKAHTIWPMFSCQKYTLRQERNAKQRNENISSAYFVYTEK